MERQFFIFFIISIFLFVDCAYSSVIEVDVSKALKVDISSFSYDCVMNIVEFNVESYNTGTIGYKSRTSIDIFNENGIVFKGWGKENTLMPGGRENSEIYWYTNSTGNFTVRVRIYYGNEIMEKNFSIEKNVSSDSENVFEIRNFRTYDDFVVFDVIPKNDVENVVFIPSNFPLGWIFEQTKIDSIRDGNTKTVSIIYKPSVWYERDIYLEIASDNGKYYTGEFFKLKKETGIKRLLHSIIDRIKLSI